MNIDKKIIEYRKRFNMTQDELANKLNVSRQTISKWENGTVLPDAYNLKEIAKVFDISLDELLDNDVASNDNDIIEAANYGINMVKKHWAKYGYVLLGYGFIITIAGFFFRFMGGLMFQTNPFTGETSFTGGLEPNMDLFANVLRSTPLAIGIVVIIIGIILIIVDKIRNKKGV